MADKAIAAYIVKYGKAPTQADHLLKFSKSKSDIPTLNYSAAKQAISNYKHQQKYESIRHGTNKSKKKSKHKSKPKSPNTTKYNIKSKTNTNNENNTRDSFDLPIKNSSKKRKSLSKAVENNNIISEHTIDEKNEINDIELSHNNREHKSIVIDNGTSLFKIGYVGDKRPIAMFHPTQLKGRVLSKSPIQRGIVKSDSYEIEDVYRHAFKDILHLSEDELSEYGVIMNCAAFNPRQTAEELCELMFETFNIKQFFISSAAVLSLYAVQKVSGVVIESGGGLTQCVPIWNGCPVAQACKRIDVGGIDIDEYLYDLLKVKYKNVSNIDMKVCKQIKEKYGYIAIDYRKESAKKIEYELDNGSVIKIGDERFKCGELLFSYLSGNGIDKQIFDSIMNCDMDIRKHLFGNIVISGGTMCMKGFKNRLNNELIQLCKNSPIKKTQKYAKKINFVVHKNRDILSWRGGSMFGSLPAFEEMWYTKEAYLENGADMTSKIENSNIFFYDEYTPKEVDLQEIQNYNQTYRRRTISVYSHKNSISAIAPKVSIASASNAYLGMSIGIKPRVSKDSLTNSGIKIEPWNDDTKGDNNDEPWNDDSNINGQIDVKALRKNSLKRELEVRNETIQSFLLQIEELSLTNAELKSEVDTLRQENKYLKHNEKKMENEKAKLQTERLGLENLKNEIKLKSVQLQREIQVIQQLFNNGNTRLQNLNVEFLSMDGHSGRNGTKVEPIND